ncbi:MAG: hypothetical protein KGI19_09380 [Thaumarchaeota archaeon]|nr:hypothetical protein [Nitrososphaerota archaeon]
MNLKYTDGYPEIQQFMLPLFLIVPFAIEGLCRIINLVKKKKTIFLKIPVFVIVSLVTFPMIIQMIESYPELNHHLNDLYGSQDSTMKITNNWILTNIHDKIIASNYPSMTFLHTGLNSVPLPTLPDQDAFERYLDHYNVSYLVFYKNSNVPTNELYADINSWPTVRFGYSEVYSVNSSHVIKLFNKIDSADISTPVLYLEKAAKLEQLGKISNATKIYDEVKNLKPKTVDMEEKICTTFTKIKKYDYAISSCNYALDKNVNDPIVLSNLAIIYQETGQRDKTLGIISMYDKMLLEGQNAEVIKCWYYMVRQLIQFDPNIKLDIVKDVTENMQMSEEQSNLKKTLLLYVEIQYLDSSKIYSSNLHYLDLNKFKTLDDALKSVDVLIQFYTTHSAQELNMDDFLLRDSLVYALNEKAELLISQQQFDDADNTYLDIEMLDNFDKTVHEKRALLLEQIGNPQEALKEYQFQERLTPNDLAIQKKITDLNIKIKNQIG